MKRGKCAVGVGKRTSTPRERLNVGKLKNRVQRSICAGQSRAEDDRCGSTNALSRRRRLDVLWD